MSTTDKIAKIVGGKPNNFQINFNEHWCYYDKVEDAVAGIDDDDFVSPEEKQRCLETGNLWYVQWYPRTPVGFVSVYASTLDAALDYLIEREIKEGQ